MEMQFGEMQFGEMQFGEMQFGEMQFGDSLLNLQLSKLSPNCARPGNRLIGREQWRIRRKCM